MGLRNWAHNLHNALGEQCVFAATVTIDVVIGEQAPKGRPHRAPDDIAHVPWDLYARRDRREHVVSA